MARLRDVGDNLLLVHLPDLTDLSSYAAAAGLRMDIEGNTDTALYTAGPRAALVLRSVEVAVGSTSRTVEPDIPSGAA